MLSNTVFRNGTPARTGARVCDGDLLTTNGTGVFDLLLDGDRESDSVHVAEGTDPRFRWTRSGCLSVDSYAQGRIVVTSRRLCMVVRTPDTLMYLSGARAQFQVARNAATQVVPVRGNMIKLQALSDQQVRALSSVQLVQRAAPVALQPKPLSLNVYRQGVVSQPAVRLPPAEVQRINSSLLRSAVMVPVNPPVAVPR